MTTRPAPTILQRALKACRPFFLSAALFSLFINLLMLVPPLYMLQVYDRVITSRSLDTLFMLTLIVVFLFIVMGAWKSCVLGCWCGSVIASTAWSIIVCSRRCSRTAYASPVVRVRSR
ncbi:hypothetical protein A8U91_02263 [Halomonas elongata]|uniref:Uncharacterized protein n=1 Tax=Halomonas elongata TaxID=2746 RepID=A0A1B8P6I8_HALEL|nr:hypothetical protein A8U91_02263 [Halomonas elongata]